MNNAARQLYAFDEEERQRALEKFVLDVRTLAQREPVKFAREILNIKTTPADKKALQNWDLDPWSIEELEAVADVWRYRMGLPTRFNHKGLNKISIRAMHGPGKTFTTALLMHIFNFAWPGLIVATAPKEKQIKTRLWPAFRKIRGRAPEWYRNLIKVDSLRIMWFGNEDHVAHGETASTTENIAGYHDDYILFIVDEASGVNEEMFPAIEGALSTGLVPIMVLIGNPTKNVGTFYDSHKRPTVAKNYYKIHVNLDRTSRVSKQWVQEMLDKYGPNSPIYLVRCEGEFAADDKNQLITMEWLERAKDSPEPDYGELWHYRLSIDVSDGGLDETIFIISKVYAVSGRRHFIRMWRRSYPTSRATYLTAQEACKIWDHYEYDPARGDDMVVDGIGVGAGVCADLIQGIPHPETEEIKKYVVRVHKGGEASDDPAQWRNRRVQSYIGYRDAYRADKITIAEDFCTEADWEDFIGQTTSVHTKPGIERVEDLQTKDEMLRQGLKSPDMGDAGAMQFCDVAPSLPVDLGGITAVGQSAFNGYDAGLS